MKVCYVQALLVNTCTSQSSILVIVLQSKVIMSLVDTKLVHIYVLCLHLGETKCVYLQGNMSALILNCLLFK